MEIQNQKNINEILKTYKNSSLKEQYIVQDIIEEFLSYLKPNNNNPFYSTKLFPIKNALLKLSRAFEFYTKDIRQKNPNKKLIGFIVEKDLHLTSKNVQETKEISSKEVWAYRKIWRENLIINNVLEEIKWEGPTKEKDEEYIKHIKLLEEAQKEIEEKGKLYPEITTYPDISFHFIDPKILRYLHRYFAKNEGQRDGTTHIPIFHEKSGKLVYGEKSMLFQENTLIFELMKIAEIEERGKEIYYFDVYKNIDHAISEKIANKRCSDCISAYNKKIEKKLKIKEFFGRGKGYYYRTT